MIHNHENILVMLPTEESEREAFRQAAPAASFTFCQPEEATREQILQADILFGSPRIDIIRENKKLGPYFVSPLDLSSRRAFLNKVVFYLKQDVFTDTNGVLTDSLETIYRRYQDDNADLFTMLIPG